MIIGFAIVFGVSLFGCSLIGGKTRPSWTDGVSSNYPAEQYLTGVGQGESRTVAEDNAYAALARIFKAQVSAQSKDWESYLLVEQRGKTQDEHRLVLDKVTRVSTDKVLENVKIVDRWFDQEAGLHYALAAMQRSQAEAALRERMAELDHAVESDVEEARRTVDKLAKARGLKRAARNLVFREALNADLRVIRPSGHGEPAAYRVQDLTRELEDFLSKNLVVEVVVTGEYVDPIEQALAEGLVQEGLQVVSSRSGSAEAQTQEGGTRLTTD
ncbi:LPP20 family lipoprotein, partial [Petrachloros mirabilis]